MADNVKSVIDEFYYQYGVYPDRISLRPDVLEQIQQEVWKFLISSGVSCSSLFGVQLGPMLVADSDVLYEIWGRPEGCVFGRREEV